jgi:cysteine synthase
MTSILDRIGSTPLIPLGRIARGSRVPVLVKCEHMNPGGSVKDRLARALIDDAEARGALAPGGTIIEATAGNTGLGLAIVAAVRGYRVVCVLPEKMSQDKRDALKAAGCEVIITPNAPPDAPESFQSVARRLAKERGYLLADQFENPANPAVHESMTGPEILREAGGSIGAFVAGAGTGGTITGVGRYLRMACPSARVVLADPMGSTYASWVRSRTLEGDSAYQVEGIGGKKVPKNLDASVIDDAELVSDDESFAMVARLIREEGLFVGGSSGTAVVAALRVAAREDIAGPVVAVLPDGWDRYRAKPWMAALITSGTS